MSRYFDTPSKWIKTLPNKTMTMTVLSCCCKFLFYTTLKILVKFSLDMGFIMSPLFTLSTKDIHVEYPFYEMLETKSV
jgi:hypothetical protein